MYDPTQTRYRYLSFQGPSNYRRFIRDKKEIQPLDPVNQESEIPAHGTYGAMLFDPRWKAKRLEIINRDKGSCVICYSTIALQVHHRQYHFIVRQNQFRQPWDYPERLMITLCENCHRKGHNKFKVPTINI